MMIGLYVLTGLCVSFLALALAVIARGDPQRANLVLIFTLAGTTGIWALWRFGAGSEALAVLLPGSAAIAAGVFGGEKIVAAVRRDRGVLAMPLASASGMLLIAALLCVAGGYFALTLGTLLLMLASAVAVAAMSCVRIPAELGDLGVLRMALYALFWLLLAFAVGVLGLVEVAAALLMTAGMAVVAATQLGLPELRRRGR